MQTITKNDFIRLLAEKTEQPIKSASDVFNTVLELMSQELSEGNTLDFANFAKIEVKERAARNGRNPATGEPIQIPATNTIKFSAKKALKDAINHD